MDRMTINIGGMSCGHCVAAVKQALSALDGVEVEHVAVGTATVTYDAGTASAARITRAIEDEGYAVVSTAA